MELREVAVPAVKSNAAVDGDKLKCQTASTTTTTFNFYFDLFICFLTICLLILDYIVNGFLVSKYYELQQRHSPYVIYFWLSLAFCCIPPSIGTFFEFVWAFEEKFKGGHKPSRCFRIIQGLFSLVFLAPVLKMSMSIIYGIKSQLIKNDEIKKRKYMKIMNHERSDGAFLCLIEKFVESSLHLIHQTCLIRTELDTEHSVYIDWIEWFKTSISLFLLPYTVTLYVAFYRKTNNKNHMTIVQGIVHFVWRFFIILSQAIPLSLFALFHPWFFGIIEGTHYVLSVMFIYLQDPKFFVEANCFAEYFYRVIIGYVYFFTYLNVSSKDTFYMTFVFYGLTFIERALMIIVWTQYTTRKADVVLNDISIIGYFLTFFLGIVIMILYYVCLHPTREVPKMKSIFTVF